MKLSGNFNFPMYLALVPGYQPAIICADLAQLIDCVVADHGTIITVKYLVQESGDRPPKVIGNY